MMLQLKNNHKLDIYNDFDRILDSIFKDNADTCLQIPPVDIWEDNEKYMLEAELPGFSADNIDIQIHNDLLTISSKPKEGENTKEPESRRWISRERNKKQFSRSFLVPAKADKSDINAVFSNGMLNLEIKKLKEQKPSSIKINVK